MPNRNVLVIVEGERAEVRFFNSMFSIAFPDQQIEYYCYSTSIHQLVGDLYPNGVFDSDLDICLLLEEREVDETKKACLRKTYTDKYLVFDFEPQHHVLAFTQVSEMLNYFNDPSDNGKLYINYPMLESFRHLAALPDVDFKNRTVALEDVRQYKQLVHNDCASTYQDLKSYNYFILINMALHHLMKANLLLTGKYSIPEVEDYLIWNCSNLLLYQQQLHKLNKCSVLNTCIWAFIDYAPSRFFNFIQSHYCELLI